MNPAFGIALALWLAPPQSPSDPEPSVLCDVAVRTHTLDYAEFADAAGLRLPGVRLREADGEADSACVGQLHAFVELRSVDEGYWELSLIASDGRAWFRTVPAEPDQAPRALASALANLVAAIEDASAEPDAHDVSLPEQLEPSVEAEGGAEHGVEGEDSVEPEPEPKPRPILIELGPRLAGALVLGLAPGPGLRGGGGAFGFDIRLPDGLAFGLELRTITIAANPARLVRNRVALGVGWVGRNGIFEIPVLVSGVVEPWVVRTAGNSTPLGQPPMIGGGARVAPGLLLGSGPLQFRLGLSLGFEIAVEAARGGVTPAITPDPTVEPILRAGGVELSASLEFGVWIPVRARR